MADKEQLKILKQGVSVWNRWRKADPDTSVDLSKAKLSKAKLSGADLAEVDLAEADLSGATLSGANLSRATLFGACLSKANLGEADLSESYLDEADLSGANLSGTNLVRAHLEGADLRNASLFLADLSRAQLRDSLFAGAAFGDTVIAFTSLKDIKGLDSCKHSGPTAIDYHTLIASGPLPEVFLRGCGFDDEFIDYLPSFWNEPFQFYSCFISYSYADKSFARRLHDALQSRGIRCWLDEHQLLPGDKIHRAIDEGIRLWDKVLLCCSKDSLASWWVDKEVEKALMKEEKLSKERGQEIFALIPLNLDGHLFEPDWQDWKKDHLKSRLAPDFSGWDKDNAKFAAQLEQVIKALRADAKARERPPKPRL